MNLPRFGRQRGRLRRWAAAGLLLLFVADLGYHLVSPLLARPGLQVGTLLWSGQGLAGGLGNHPSGCGIPGHNNTFSHHHHFPAVLTQASLTVPLCTLASVSATRLDQAFHPSFVTSLTRAPPKQS